MYTDRDLGIRLCVFFFFFVTTADNLHVIIIPRYITSGWGGGYPANSVRSYCKFPPPPWDSPGRRQRLVIPARSSPRASHRYVLHRWMVLYIICIIGIYYVLLLCVRFSFSTRKSNVFCASAFAAIMMYKYRIVDGRGGGRLERCVPRGTRGTRAREIKPS